MDAMDETPEHSPARSNLAAERAVGLISALTVIVLFSGFTLISRLGSATALQIWDIAFLRFAIGGLVLLPVFLRFGLSGISMREACLLAFLGGIGFALFAYSGFYLAPAAHGAVLLHGTIPLFTFFIVTILTQRIERNRALIGILIIAAGIAFMAADTLSRATSEQLVGDGFLLAASFCWSAYGVKVRRLGLPAVRASAIVACLSMVVFVPLYGLLPNKGLFLADWDELLIQGLFQGVFIGALSIFVYTKAVSTIGPGVTALFTAAVPCVTTLGAIPLLSEIPTLLAILGVAIVSVGMLFALSGAVRMGKRDETCQAVPRTQ